MNVDKFTLDLQRKINWITLLGWNGCRGIIESTVRSEQINLRM